MGNNGNDQSDADDSDRNTDGDADHAYAESFKQYRIAQLLCRGSHGREDAELLCPFIQWHVEWIIDKKNGSEHDDGDDNASHRVHEHIEQVVIGNPHETQYVVIEDVSMVSGTVYIGAYLTWIFQGDKQAEAVRFGAVIRFGY